MLPQYWVSLISSEDVRFWSSVALGQIECFMRTCRFSDILIIGVKFPQVIPSNNDFMT